MILRADSTNWGADAGLFDDLFEQHRGAIFSYLFGRTGNRDTAKDLTQETFVKVWRSISEAAKVPDARRRYWIVAIARNVLIDWSRRVSTRPAAEAVNHEVLDPAASPHRTAEANDELNRLDTAIRDLPEDQRTVLALSVMEGLKSSEIGEILGISPGTARYWLSEARKHLAQHLDDL